VSLLRGEKNHFGPLSKNYTDMAALRAGLPVITVKMAKITADICKNHENRGKITASIIHQNVRFFISTCAYIVTGINI